VLDASYDKHREAYIRNFDKLGFEYVIVRAHAAAMGGSKSAEFLAKAAVGEDTYVTCPACGFSANVEAGETPSPPPVPYDDAPDAHVEDTPDTPTIDSLVQLLNERFPREDRAWAAEDTLKNVLMVVTQLDGTSEPLAIGVPGDREVDAKRLEAQVAPAEVEAFTEFDRHPALVKGYIGPQVLGTENESKIRYLVDPRVVPGTRWITGANQPGKHVFDLVAGRDFTWDGVIEAAEVLAGDPAPDGSGPLELARGVEIGHIFQLGRKYAEALDLKVLDENGKLVTVTMGSYGVGVSRAVAAIAESNHDELGLIWPREVAPADVHVVATGKDPAIFEAAEALAGELVAAGLTVLYDDRPKVSPGVKFKDAELLGMPTIVTVGRGLEGGTIELRDRTSGEREEVPVADAAARILGVVRG
jgi:prolyl-tRNA synthetase